jgi:hypothetical protein
MVKRARNMGKCSGRQNLVDDGVIVGAIIVACPHTMRGMKVFTLNLTIKVMVSRKFPTQPTADAP